MWIATMIVTIGINWGLFVYYIAVAVKSSKKQS